MLPAMGVSIGANLLASYLKTRGERRRLKRLREAKMAALKPLEDVLSTRQYGLGQSEGNILRRVQSRTLGGLAQRGLLDSNVAAPAVAQAVAPVEAQHEERNQALMAQIAQMKSGIEGETSLPGYEEAFAGALGSTGDFASMYGARQQARQDYDSETERMLQLFEAAKQPRDYGSYQDESRNWG